MTNDAVDNLNLMVLHIGRKHCRTDWNYRNVCSPFARIYYIISGEAELDTPDGTLPLKAGHMYLIPPFTPHTCRCRNEFDHFYIHLYNNSGPYLLEDWSLPAEIIGSPDSLGHILRLTELCPGMELRQTDPKAYDNNRSITSRINANRSRDLHARIESRALIYLILKRFTRLAVPKNYVHDRRINAVLAHIRTHLAEPLELDKLAALVHLSKEHLIRLFGKEIGMPPLAYATAKRIEAAQLRLVTENTSVKEIAFSLGFEDQSYFHRLFKKHTGMTPLRYRRSVSAG